VHVHAHFCIGSKALGLLVFFLAKKKEVTYDILEFIFLVKSSVLLLDMMNVSKLEICKMRSRKVGALQRILHKCQVRASCLCSIGIMLKKHR